MTSDQGQQVITLLTQQGQDTQTALTVMNTQLALAHEVLMALLFLNLFLAIVLPLTLAFGRKSSV